MFTARPQDPFVVASVKDEAIDRDSTEGRRALEEYAASREDPAILRLVPGAKLTLFRCRPLGHHARIFVEGQPTPQSKYVLAFHACVVSADNLALAEGPWKPRFVRAGWKDGAEMLSDESVEQIGDAGLGSLIDEVGSVCLQRANLTAAQKKAYSLPRGFVASFPTSSAATAPDTTGEAPPGST